MKIPGNKDVWLVVGSQHLYGPDVIDQVAANAKQVVTSLNQRPELPAQLVLKQVVTTSEEIYHTCVEANQDPLCVGVVVWMHTFSPAKMWIRGLRALNKPLCHLHTQFNEKIPWEQIDMDFMNLNQSAHGDRELAHLLTRMQVNRKIIVGYWQHQEVIKNLSDWMRAALGWYSLQHLKVARFGDNMREVAVTEGDKVAAQIQLGVSVNGYGLGDLTDIINGISGEQAELLVQEYLDSYHCHRKDSAYASLVEAARIELGLRSFLELGGFGAFTDTFENLHGLHQLPGIAVQRLMNDGYGFGAEGDWKTAALLYVFKVMSKGLSGGSSFMEDYTYHFDERQSLVLGAHMLEICPSISSAKPRCEVHPLSIGDKHAPARLIFDADPGTAINASLVDLGDRLRLLVNTINVIDPPQDLPKLPVARALWQPEPNLEISAQAWMLAGGAHHTVFSQAITMEIIEDLAEIAGLELVIIDNDTRIRDFKDQLRRNQSYYQ